VPCHAANLPPIRPLIRLDSVLGMQPSTHDQAAALRTPLLSSVAPSSSPPSPSSSSTSLLLPPQATAVPFPASSAPGSSVDVVGQQSARIGEGDSNVEVGTPLSHPHSVSDSRVVIGGMSGSSSHHPPQATQLVSPASSAAAQPNPPSASPAASASSPSDAAATGQAAVRPSSASASGQGQGQERKPSEGRVHTINVSAKDKDSNMSTRPVPDPLGAPGVPASAQSGPTPAAQARQDDRHFTLSRAKAEFPKNEKGKPVAYSKETNCVITSKYTIVTFLPLNLFEQFCNLANLYFLLVGLFQIIPVFSTTNGNPTMYQPLAFIVFVSACRAAKEDWDQHKADASRNGFPYDVMTDKGWKATESGDIRVGNIVKVKQNNMIPADMLFLGSSLSKGHCFIDKSNLNGETTLEVMNSMNHTRNWCKDDASLVNMSLTLDYEPPNKRFDSFRGKMMMHDDAAFPDPIDIDGKSLMMRETNLRNCDYIYGLVVYTGNDTKIQRSNLEGEKPKTKVSFIMRQVNTYLIYMLLLQSILCIVGGVLAGAFREGFTSDMWFLDFDAEGSPAPDAVRTGVYAFFSWFILLSQMVPISLIVSAEVVKFIQSVFIEKDLHLYYPKLNKPAKCNSSTIHEDLGLIDYIFSDKTGTLTQNKMEFRYLLTEIGEFGSKETDIAKSVKTRQQQLADKKAGRPVTNSSHPWSQLVASHIAPRDPDIDKDNCCTAGACGRACWNAPVDDSLLTNEEIPPLAKNEFTEEERRVLLMRLWGKPPAGESAEETERARAVVHRYLLHMALSNTVKPYEDEGEMKFQAESAEELAMAQFSRRCGFFKRQLNPTVLEITQYDENLQEKPEKIVETYNHVATFGFTSKRARVTVIYQQLDGAKKGTVHVMMKGQDTVALPLIKLNVDEDELLDQLKNMSTNGLRTLVAGYSELDSAWWQERAAAYTDVIQRDATPASEGHPEKCIKEQCHLCAQHELFERVEKEADLQYLGCIGLEDQLQLLVPECIGDCIRGGIKVWMITGDKLETAKNIGLACNLIDPDMIPSFSSADIQECAKEFQRARLVEITGSWASLANNDEELGRIFDIFDRNNNGTLDVEELEVILNALRCDFTQDKLRSVLAAHVSDGELSPAEVNSIDRSGFIALLKSTQMSKFDAVWFDIEEGIKTYNAIKDHEQYPVSLLIDRAAFQVLFPGKAGAKVTQADLDSLGPNVTAKKMATLREMFFQLAGRSKSVVFARAEPAHKKRMVTEIQARVRGAITLAIGDGANDTDMITAAHIGVGIAGVEGTAATNASDYAIGTFRMLHRLLFVHGFYSYQRTSKLVNFIFYKASLVAVMMFLFGFFSAMSGQQFLPDAPYQLYNVMYTALPIMVVAVFDKLLPAGFLEDNPVIYQRQKHTAFDPVIFSGWIFRAFLHACIIYFATYWSFGVDNISQSGGRADGIWFFATTAYYATVMVPTLLILYDMANITIIHWISIACSVAALYLVTWIMNYLYTIVPDLAGVVNTMYASAMHWLVVLAAVFVCMGLELLWRGAMRELRPSIVQIYQEIYRLTPAEQKAALDPARLMMVDTLNGDSPSSTSPEATSAKGDGDAIHVDVSVSHRRGARASDESRRNSIVSVGHDSTRGSQKTKSNMVRAMLRFRNLTGAHFDSAAQAQLQQHDRFVFNNSPKHTLKNQPSASFNKATSGGSASGSGSNSGRSSARASGVAPPSASSNSSHLAIASPSEEIHVVPVVSASSRDASHQAGNINNNSSSSTGLSASNLSMHIVGKYDGGEEPKSDEK